jgi:hypothetical protein
VDDGVAGGHWGLGTKGAAFGIRDSAFVEGLLGVGCAGGREWGVMVN